jgi:hypothetical protein
MVHLGMRKVRMGRTRCQGRSGEYLRWFGDFALLTGQWQRLGFLLFQAGQPSRESLARARDRWSRGQWDPREREH